MVRADLKKKDSLSGKAVGFLLINLLPIGAMAWIGWGLWRGRFTLDDLRARLPEGFDDNVLFFLASVVLLFVMVTFVVPVAHLGVKHFLGSLARSAHLRSTGGMLRRLWEGLLWPFRKTSCLLLKALRGVAFVVSFALIALAIVFIVRFFEPRFLADQVRPGAWIERLGR